MSDDYKLNPCPFCGGEAMVGMEKYRIFTYEENFYVYCKSCDCSLGYNSQGDGEAGDTIYDHSFKSEREAIIKWNTRVPDQEQKAENKADAVEMLPDGNGVNDQRERALEWLHWAVSIKDQNTEQYRYIKAALTAPPHVPQSVDEMEVARAVVNAMRESRNPDDLAKFLIKFIAGFPNGVKVVEG
jgi:Lar family restriction alleviation protein